MWRGGRTTSARRTGRSSSASRAALKSRPSMGGEKPVGPRPVGGRTRFVSAFKSGFARSATLGLPRKALPAGNGASGAAKFTPRGTTYVFVNVVVAPRYVARVQPGSGGLSKNMKVKNRVSIPLPSQNRSSSHSLVEWPLLDVGCIGAYAERGGIRGLYSQK